MTNEKAVKITETVNSGGWPIIEEWLNQQEKDITRAGVNGIINLKSSEFAKWQPYYAGELNIIDKFRDFVKKSQETEKPKMKNALTKKFKDLF